MTIQTIRTTAGDFKIRSDETTTQQDIANKIARKLGFSAAWPTNSSGARGSYEINLGRMTGRQMSVARTITVYR